MLPLACGVGHNKYLLDRLPLDLCVCCGGKAFTSCFFRFLFALKQCILSNLPKEGIGTKIISEYQLILYQGVINQYPRLGYAKPTCGLCHFSRLINRIVVNHSYFKAYL